MSYFTPPTKKRSTIPILLSQKNSFYYISFMIFCFIMVFIVGIFTERPEILYFCAFAFIINIIAIIFYLPILSSMSVSFFPIYVILMIDIFRYQSLGIILHIINFSCCLYIFVRDGRTLIPIIVLLTGFLNIALILTFSWYLKTEFTDNHFFLWQGELLTPYFLIIYVITLFILFYISWAIHEKELPITTIELQSLPKKRDMSFMDSIITIDMSHHKLTEVPISILPLNSKYIDLSHNNIKTITESICDISPNTRINLAWNPMKTSPACLKCDITKTNCRIIKQQKNK